MKKIILMFTAVVLCAGMANAFPETSSFNTQEMQRLQNFQYNTRNDYDNASNFSERKKARQDAAKKAQERQQRIEARAQQVPTNTNSQFVNDNGVLKIERQ